MPNKDFTLDSGLAITVYKRKANRSLRLSIAPSGKVRVSIPAWAPYRAGVEFARSRQAWIREQYRPALALVHGQAVGKNHHLEFVPLQPPAKTGSRVSGTTVLVSYPANEPTTSRSVQGVAEEACVRALRRQAKHLLPQRLAYLAALHGFSYNEVAIKRLKSRWGSCDQHRNIVLNLFLMQLPWELIDYVLLHELTHTRVLKHGPDFWQAMAEVSPAATTLRKNLRAYQPTISRPAQIRQPMA
jgi:predicted metal-dependent hydrolase